MRARLTPEESAAINRFFACGGRITYCPPRSYAIPEKPLNDMREHLSDHGEITGEQVNQAVKLRLEGFSNMEVALKLGIGVGSVKNQTRERITPDALRLARLARRKTVKPRGDRRIGAQKTVSTRKGSELRAQEAEA